MRTHIAMLLAALSATALAAPALAASQPPLIAAARAGDAAEVARLVEAGADVDKGGDDDFSPLLVALYNHHEGVARYLLEHGADASHVGAYGVTGLHLTRDVGVVRMLLDHGADLNASAKTYGTPLHAAIQRDEEAIVRLLLDRGAKTGIGDRNGSTPLHYAAGRGSDRLVSWLLAAGADPDARNADGFTPLHWAASNDRPSTVELLVGAGARPGARAADGRTPSMLARDKGHLALARRLDTLTPR